MGVKMFYDCVEMFVGKKFVYWESYDIVMVWVVVCLLVLSEFCLLFVKIGG